MRLGDLDALKEVFSDWHNWHTVIGYGKVVFLDKLFEIIDNAPTVKTYCYFCGQTEHGQIDEADERSEKGGDD